MNVLVIGAAGKSGRLVVERAVLAGHTVTALVHHPESYEPPAGVRVVAGDAADAATLDNALPGQDAVVDAIGGKTPYLQSELERGIAQAVIDAMHRHGIRRLVVISVLGAGDSKNQAGFFYEHLLMPVFLRGAIVDKNAMEAVVEKGGVDFTLVRPPMLTDGAATGHVRVVEGGDKAHKITRADLAAFVVEQLADNTHLNQAVTIANS